MLNKVTEYKLLQALTAAEMTDIVTQAMTDNWVPSGAPVVADGAVYQAMVKFESPAE